MTQVRVLVGTRKGAFVLTSDGKREKWEVSGPHFAGWEIYHVKGSPVDPDRIYASQTSGWFGQVMQCSSDGGPSRALLVHRTRASGLRIAAGMSHVITGPEKMANRIEAYPDLARFNVATEVAPYA